MAYVPFSTRFIGVINPLFRKMRVITVRNKLNCEAILVNAANSGRCISGAFYAVLFVNVI